MLAQYKLYRKGMDSLYCASILAGPGTDRKYAGAVQTVHALAIRGVVRFGIARAYVIEIQLRVVRAGLPGCRAAIFPGVGELLVWPSLGTLLAGRGDRVGAPQSLARFRIVAVKEATCGAVSARHPGDQYAIDDDRGNHPDVAFLEIGEFFLPDFLAGLHVERHHMRIHRLAEQLAVVDRRRSSHDRAGVSDTQRRPFVLDRRAPDLPAGRDVDGEGPARSEEHTSELQSHHDIVCRL